jgi:RNA polymerase sigma factor (TIGR02999 family)
MSDVTRLLTAAEAGDQRAAAELLPLVYDELRKLAAARLAREKPGQTLQPTALVHEAYLRLVGGQAAVAWNGRGHFFAAAAEAMRRILIAGARRRQARKRGGGLERLDLDGVELVGPEPCEKLLALDGALDRLSRSDPVKAQVVKLRYFAGLTNQEAASALGISTATAERYWAYARAWLQTEIAAELQS